MCNDLCTERAEINLVKSPKYYFKKICSEMAQWVKALPYKLGNLRSIMGTHIEVERENQVHKVVH